MFTLLAAMLVLDFDPVARGEGSRARLVEGAISDTDYPAAAARNGETGAVSMRYTVDRDGRVKNCEVTESSGSVALDVTSCALVSARFRFEPARDGRGRAQPESRRQRVVWRLPTDVPAAMEMPARAAFERGEIRISLALADDGMLCAVEINGNAFNALGTEACSLFRAAPLADVARGREPRTIVTRLQPAGSAPLPPTNVPGALQAHVAADVEVNQAGRVTACRPLQVTGAPSAQPGEEPDICLGLQSHPLPFEASDTPAVRRARVDVEVYRLGAGQV